MPLRRMAPDTPAASFDKRAATGLRHARCLFHPLREAAARCPHCGGTFCRECVTDEEGKLACPPCLRRMALFFALLRWRMNTPEEHLNFGVAADDRPPEKNNG